MIQDEHLYLAAPVCFYPRGMSMWNAYRKEAEYYGATVELPNDADPADAPGETRAERCTNNCDIWMRRCTACLANIENHRGVNPDAGTVYELGMAYGLGLKCYAYTRDKRPMGEKYMGPVYAKDDIIDKDGERFENRELPFADSLIGSCKIVEGDFSDCLRTFMEDIEEESKKKAVRGYSLKKAEPVKNPSATGRPVVYLSDSRRGRDFEQRHAEMKKILWKYGFEAYAPGDAAPGVPVLQQTGDPYARAYNRFDHCQQHVRDCDIYLAVLEDRRGYEVDADVAFESGMASMFKEKKMYGWMEDGRGMAERVVHGDPLTDTKDIMGWGTEPDEFPVNMMYGTTRILNGMSFEEAVKKMAEELL